MALSTRKRGQLTYVLAFTSATALWAATARAQSDDDGSYADGSDSSGSGSGSDDDGDHPNADPALLNDGNISVTTPSDTLTACDDNYRLHWEWSGDDTAAWYHRVDIWAHSTLAAAVNPTTIEATLAAGGAVPPGLTLISPTRGIRLSEQEYRWRPVNLPAAAYTIYVIIRDRPTKYGQSGVFTVEEGDDTSCIVNTSPIPSITASPSNGSGAQPTQTGGGGGGGNISNSDSSSSSSSSSGTIAVAVAIPIIVIVAALAGFFFWRRKRRAQLAGSSSYKNVPSSSARLGGAASGGLAAALAGRSKKEETLPIAHTQLNQRALDSPSPMEQRSGGGWASKFMPSVAAKSVPASAGAGLATGGAAAAATANKQGTSPNEDKYGARASELDLQSTVALQRADEPFNDYHAASSSPLSESSPTRQAPAPNNRRPVMPALNGWYLGKDAQEEVPSLPPAADEIVPTDSLGHGGHDGDDANDYVDAETSVQHQTAPTSDLPAGSTAAALAAAAAAPRNWTPHTSTPASPALGQQAALHPVAPTQRGQGEPSRPPSAYNNANNSSNALGMGQASASTSTSSLRAGGAHRRVNSGFAGVGSKFYATAGDGTPGSVGRAHSPLPPSGAALNPPPPTAALMSPPSAASTTSIPAPGHFPVGVSFSPGQIVSFGSASQSQSLGSRSMVGVGASGSFAGRGSAGAAPPSAYHNAAQAQQYPPRSPTPTQMLGPRSTTPLGFAPAGGHTGRYPSWYGSGPTAMDDNILVQQQQQTSSAGSGSGNSGASSPRTALSPFGDQHQTRS